MTTRQLRLSDLMADQQWAPEPEPATKEYAMSSIEHARQKLGEARMLEMEQQVSKRHHKFLSDLAAFLNTPSFGHPSSTTRKLDMIKLLRNLTGSSLMDCKGWVDSMSTPGTLPEVRSDDQLRSILFQHLNPVQYKAVVDYLYLTIEDEA